MAEDNSSLPSIQYALQLIDLKTAARLESSGRGGRPPHIASICRWIQHGIRLRSGGRLHLRAVRVPSGWRTSRQWLNDFRSALTADRLGHDIDDDHGADPAGTTVPTLTASPVCRSAAARRAASERAAELLKHMGS
jgi:hypothetical protein